MEEGSKKTETNNSPAVGEEEGNFISQYCWQLKSKHK